MSFEKLRGEWVAPAVVLGVMMLVVLVSYVRLQTEASAKKIDSMEYELQERQERIAELKANNVDKRKQVDALKNDEEAIVEFARDELGMVKPGELVLKNKMGLSQ